MTRRDVDYIVKAGEKAGLPNVRLIGKGYYKGVNALGKYDAFDAAVDAFMGAWHYFDASRGKFSTIAYTCMNSAIVKQIKHRKTFNARGNRSLVNEGDPDLLQWSSAAVVSDDPGPHQRAASNEAVERVRSALNVLPERHATIIRRIHLNGESHSDVARSMGISRQRIHQLMERGYKLMRPHLGGLS